MAEESREKPQLPRPDRNRELDGSRQFAPATSRNREPLLAALRGILPRRGMLLEIGSGTGEHAVFLAGHFPELIFQPSDPDPAARASVSAWIAHSDARNVLPPRDLDCQHPDAFAFAAGSGSNSEPADSSHSVRAVMAVNVIHISPWQTCLGLLRGASELLPAAAPLILYGPFRRDGVHTAPSNAEFDAMLRSRNPAWGVRDLEEVASAAAERGLALDKCIEMPANNLVVVFRK